MIYLDAAASSPVPAPVARALGQAFERAWGNPSSLHAAGRSAAALVEECRDAIASAINASPREIILTSGGTESVNLALTGFMRSNAARGGRLVIADGEHEAVGATARALEAEGFRVAVAPLDRLGRLTPESLNSVMTADTVLVSAMHVNNVIGTVNPVRELARVAHSAGAAFHTDACASFARVALDVKADGIDLLSATAHKCAGPKGIGFLYAGSGVALSPIMLGGGQERGMRSGTLPSPLAAGFTAALEWMRDYPAAQVRLARDTLISRILCGVQDAVLNGDPLLRADENAHFSIPGVDAGELLARLDRAGVCASAGSACSAGSLEAPQAVKAIGAENRGAPLRLTVPPGTDEAAADEAALIIIGAVKALRGW